MYTPEQNEAITTTDRNLVVVAGAGSGKTFVLVERYVHLLRSNDLRLNALVAITFTRQAALEMRNRVRQKLEMAAQDATTPAEKQRWSGLLSEMDSARIDTIHGLCATLLRANAAEANVDPGFEIIEPVEAESMLSDAIDSVVQSLAEGSDDAARLFTEYDMQQVRDVLRNSDLLSAPLDDIPDTPDELFQQWQDEWQKTYLEQRNSLQQNSEFAEALAWLQSCDAPAGDKLGDRVIKVQSLLPQFLSDDAGISFAAMQEIIEEIDLNGGSKNFWGSVDVVKAAKDDLRTIRGKLCNLCEDMGETPGDFDRRAAAITMYCYRLVQQVRDTYTQMKAVDGRLDFDDLEARTAHLLDQHPQVRERYRGEEFRYLLVDEFQDTNDAQWRIVRALADMENSALFVVGDMKQSIYGFRGADVRVFGEVRDKLRQRENGAELTLSTSFRARPGLLAIFNQLFAHLMTRHPESIVSEYQIQFTPETDAMTAHRQAVPGQQVPPLQFNLVCTKSDSIDDGKLSADEGRQWEAQTIAERLKQLYNDGVHIHDKATDKLRPLQYGDAAILFRATTHLTLYEEALKVAEVPFVTVGGRGYYDRQEVWDMLNLLRALHNPADNLSLAAALRSPLFGFSDDMLFALRLLQTDDGSRLSLWDALQAAQSDYLDDTQLQQIVFARETLDDLRQLAGRVAISDLLRHALAKTGYLAMLSGLPNGARLRRNVEKLVDIAEDSGKITLGAFTRYLSDLTSREVREGEATLDTEGAVQLMTIHASKGLEFPVVVLADASFARRGGFSSVMLYDDVNQRIACRAYDDEARQLTDSYPYRRAKTIASQKDDAEALRLLYVAATRTRDLLIISGQVKKLKDGWGTYGWLGTILETMHITDHLDISQPYMTLEYAGEPIDVHMPAYDAAEMQQWQGADTTPDWAAIEREAGLPESGQMPARMKPLDIAEIDRFRHIAATQLTAIGGWQYSIHDEDRAYYIQHLRRAIFDDAPARIRSAVPSRPRVRQRQVGEVVHEALRYWQFPQMTGGDLDEILRSYAWQQDITDPDDVAAVVGQARKLLEQFQTNDLYARLDVIRRSEKPFYSEMPFVLRSEMRLIHGIIDVLFQGEDGTWTILDYKTSYIPRDMSAEDHARRYHLQLGAYAAAVEQQLGETPAVYIHYIQYNKIIHIPTATWQREIQQLENYLGELAGRPHV